MEYTIFQNSHAVLVIGDFDDQAIQAVIKVLDVAPGDHEIFASEDIKIAQIRELIHWLHLKPFSGGRKLAVILEAEKMTAEAANALLKTLEEPPAFATIILTTLNEQKILPTIHSRCQKVRVMSDPHKKLGDNYLSPEKISQMTIKEKFDWVSQIVELPKPEIIDILTAWQIEYRQKLLAGVDNVAVLKEISRAKDLLSTNISLKLLLENLILNF